MCAGASCYESREQKRLRGTEKNKGLASKRATVMQARMLTVDLAALESEDNAYLLLPFRQRRGGAPPCVAHFDCPFLCCIQYLFLCSHLGLPSSHLGFIFLCSLNCQTVFFSRNSNIQTSFSHTSSIPTFRLTAAERTRCRTFTSV